MIIWTKHGRLLSWLPTSSLAPLMLQHYSVGFDEIVGVSLLSRWHAFFWDKTVMLQNVFAMILLMIVVLDIFWQKAKCSIFFSLAPLIS